MPERNKGELFARPHGPKGLSWQPLVPSLWALKEEENMGRKEEQSKAIHLVEAIGKQRERDTHTYKKW